MDYHLHAFTLPMSKEQPASPAWGDGQHNPFQATWPPQEDTHALKGLCKAEPSTFKLSSAVLS